MTAAVLSANLGNFDTPHQPITQLGINYLQHTFTDEDFPPITGLTPRFQYRIPKIFGWQIFPGRQYYLWMDAAFTLATPDSLKWFVDRIGNNDFAFFAHPNRNTIREEVDHIEEQLNKKGKTKGSRYLLDRYENGLHKEQYTDICLDKDYVDDALYHSGVFIYKDSEHTRDVMRLWWMHQSRYWTCDQVALPYILKDSAVVTLPGAPDNCEHITRVSNHA